MIHITKSLKSIVFRLIFFFVPCITYAGSTAWTDNFKGIEIDVYRLKNTENLKLFLNHTEDNAALRTFHNLENSLSNCEGLKFAMNGGMFHTNYTPVGLYIENFKVINTLNTQQNQFGNFFLQPNGVFAWNKGKAGIYTTQQFQQQNNQFQYATQSGPILVLDHKINSIFQENSGSKKIRNAVGISEDGVYFAISRQKINFYDFADFFKTKLKNKHALYLDGSISASMIPELNRYTQKRYLGPMIADIDETACQR